MTSTRCFAVLLIAPILSLGGRGLVWAGSTALIAGRIVDPVRGELGRDLTVLIEGGKIRKIGRDLELPGDVERIDLGDATLLPGFYDVHTHLCTAAELSADSVSGVFDKAFLYTLQNPTAYRAIVGAATAKEMLEAGFTTVRDLGNSGQFADVALKRALRHGWVRGPTTDISGKALSPFGGQFQLSPETKDLGRQDYAYADSHDEIRRAIRENLHYGADWIKVIVDDQAYSYGQDDLDFIVAEASASGRKVAAHCGSDEATAAAVAAGVASIEHATGASEATLKLAAQAGVVLVGTEHSKEMLMEAGVPADFAEHRAGRLSARLDRARKAGVELAFGSDVFWSVEGKTRGQVALGLLDAWLQAGMGPEEILRALISTPAKLLDDEEKRGSVSEGFDADLVATRDDPMKDPRALQDVIFVMKRGRVVVSKLD